jgi:hypothetical protein
MSGDDSLEIILRSLGLHVVLREFAQAIAKAERENWGYRRFLHYLAQCEVAERVSHKVTRLLDQAKIPAEFTLAALEQQKLGEKPRRLLPTLLSGDFVRRGDNLLCFGLPGRGKSAYVAAIARHLVQQYQMKVLFIPTFKLVSELLVAKAKLSLPRLLERLHKFDVICCDDIGYVHVDHTLVVILVPDDREVEQHPLVQRIEPFVVPDRHPQNGVMGATAQVADGPGFIVQRLEKRRIRHCMLLSGGYGFRRHGAATGQFEPESLSYPQVWRLFT